MRKALVFFALASAAAPAFASAASPDDERRDRRAENVQRADADDSDDEPQRRERPARIERSDDDGGPSEARELRRAHRSGDSVAPSGPAGPPPALVQQSDAPDTVRTRRSRERFRENTPGAIQEGSHERRRIVSDRFVRTEAPPVSRVPRAGTQPPARSGSRWRGSTHHWRGDWRSDRRYDWRSHRSRYYWLFNLAFYRDPFGWGYQPYSIGWRMWPSYYSQSYWLNDPWRYRLPYAPPGYRWIRYYDDAILVDTWDGQVVDVIYDFFW